ncbi:MAG: PatB family C-S lyase [Prevotellaceae bacterium]|nr:PatB family C-S lyase [Prevotellaceae bacterium]
MTYDFDKVIDRHGTDALKTDALADRYGNADLLPLWVADMDFETPLFITDALRRRLDHSLFGYTVEPADYRPSIIDWIREHHGWKVKPEWLCYIPGIVKGIGMAINVFVAKDEKVIIQPPVYHPFRLTTLGNGREVVYNPLKETVDGSYEMDFENLEQVVDDKCRLLILSNPHNPGGVVWSADTLARLASFCYNHNIIVLSDEIHCDMALWNNRHIPFATVSEEAAECSITFGAPSKTFNIAGIVSSYAVIPSDGLRKKYFGWLEANELNEANIFSPIATIAAFRNGEQWRKEMLAYVEGNIEYVISYINENIPQIRPWRPQASFLIWLDCRGLGLGYNEMINLFINEAHLALNDGNMFGKEGKGFMRMNVGTSRKVLEQALEQLKDAVRKHV